MAIEGGNHETAWLLLGDPAHSSCCSSSSSTHSEIEGDFEGRAYQALEQAYRSKDHKGAIFYFEKLAEIYCKRGDFFKAAHLLNGALSLAEDEHSKLILLSKLESIEIAFAFQQTGHHAPPTYRNYLQDYRRKLNEIRLRAAGDLASEWVSTEMTASFKELFAELILDSLSFLGMEELPNFAVIGFGSMARNEMSPYSDLEFAFLTEESPKENIHLLRILYRLLSLKLINMGETKIELIRSKRIRDTLHPAVSLVPSGFSMDSGAISPGGKDGIYELIGSPEELAQFQKEEWFSRHQSEIILVNALATSCYIFGDEALVQSYQKKVESILDQRPSPLQPKLRHSRAIELMRGHVVEFKPSLTLERTESDAFNVKKEFYRLFQTIISALALYHGIKAQSTLQQIDELKKAAIFQSDGAAQLKKVFHIIFELRIRTHLFYQDENETLCRTSETGRDFLITSEIDINIFEIWQTLLPLHKAAIEFLSGNRAAFSNSSFYEERLAVEYDVTQEAIPEDLLTASIVLLPRHATRRAALGKNLHRRGKIDEAVLSYNESLTLLLKEHGTTPHPDTAAALTGLALAQLESDWDWRAKRTFLEALDEYNKLYKKDGRINFELLLKETAFNYLIVLNNLVEMEQSCDLINQLHSLVAHLFTYISLSDHFTNKQIKPSLIESTQKIYGDLFCLLIANSIVELSKSSDTMTEKSLLKISTEILKHFESERSHLYYLSTMRKISYRYVKIASDEIESFERSKFESARLPKRKKSVEQLVKWATTLETAYKTLLEKFGEDHFETKKARVDLYFSRGALSKEQDRAHSRFLNASNW